ncbi:phage antirepressor KilAC domain-containing protein [Lactobacillus acetotolerans]|uniref:phage antirepressor KilAC domain-containing protein n=1 Tax=Lactobacillus acetotolerans TaxID=1600 RepID=UPI002FD981A0
MNNLKQFSNGSVNLPVRQLDDGSIEFDAEKAAIGLGISFVAKSGNEVVRWDRVRKYLSCPQVGKGDFISEPQFYKLAIKANNKTAERFQDWVTNEVLPSIRKNGMYATPESAAELLKDPVNLIQLLQNYADTQSKLVEEHDQRLIVEQQLSEAKPKADYTDQVLRSRGTMIVSEFAQDYGMSPRAFNKLLHESGVQYKARGVWVLYSKYQGKGYTKTTTHSYQHSNGLMGGRLQMEWTQKGRLFLYEFLKTQGVLPVMEQQELDLKVM